MTTGILQSQRDLSQCRWRCVLATMIIWQLCANSIFAVDAAKKVGPELSHGPREFLVHSLLQSPEDARLVAAAGRHFDLGEYVPAFEALLAVFSREHGQFSPVFRGKPITETSQAALQLLLSAPYSARRAWVQTVEPDASNALNRATQVGDRSAILQVARRYPLTPSAFRALSVTAASAWRSGQRQVAAAILAELESTYASTRLSFPVNEGLRVIRQRIQESDVRPAQPQLATIPVRQDLAEPALPGTGALWTWQQNLWQTPQVVPSTAVFNLPVGRSYLSRNVWRPAFRGNDVILRTPTQVRCFDKTSGKTLWSINTDTLAPDFSNTPDAGHELLSQLAKGNSATSHSDLIQMDDFGTVTATDDLVVFVDHFRRLRADVAARQQIDLRNRRHLDSLLSDPHDGSRLVCVSTTPTPHVLWSVGDSPDFQYVIESASEARTFESKTASEENPFLGQTFLGPPLAHDRQLFVLSTDRERVWLSCLAQGTGRLEWKTPISFHDADERQSRQLYLRITEKIHGASLCGVSGDTLVCALNNGLVVGTRVYDGHLLWATNFRDASLADDPRTLRQGLSAYINARSNGGTFRPVLHDGKIVWSAPRSLYVQCADIATGKLIWSRSREAEGTGTLEGSADQYAVAAEDDHVLLIGERHLRSISLADGEQRWVSRLPQRSGRAFCASGTCLVPCLDGTLRSFDAATGKQRAIAQGVDSVFAGSLYMDDDVVCASTPVSVQVFPSVSFQRYQSSGSLPALEAQLRETEFQLRAGHEAEALVALKELWAGPEVSKAPQIRKAIRAALLAVIREQASRQSPASLDDELLDTLDLTASEELALNVLSGTELSSRGDEDREFLGDSPPEEIEVTRSWRLRSDVAALSLQTSTAIPIVPSKPRIGELAMERALLDPRLVGKTEAQQGFAEKLIEQDDRAAAEMFLMTTIANASETERKPLSQLLSGIRSGGVRPPRPADADAPDDPQFSFSEQSDLSNSLASLIRAKPQVLKTPDWFGHRLLLAGTKLHTVSNESGAVSVPFDLPAGASPEPVEFRDNLPALIPLSGIDHVGAVSLANQNPKQLWWKKIERDETDLSPVTIGSFGPNHMIVATGSSLQCVHPLTGSVLWRRRFYPAEVSQNTFYSSIRIVGDSEVTAVLGEHLRSCSTFDTATGRERGDVKLELDGRQIPLVVGRRLLYVHAERLVLKDLKDGTNVLAEKPPITIASNGRAQLLSNRRAGVITADGNFVVLDMESGEVRLNCAVKSKVDLQRMTGMRILERSGRFYVMIKTTAPMQYGLSNSSAVDDDRVDYGVLLSVDEETGNVLWSRDSTAAVMPTIFGDDSPFLVLWSRKNDFSTRRLGSSFSDRTYVTSQLTIIDRNTGETLVKDQPFTASDLLRCAYDAKAQRLTIRTERSVIEATYR